MSSIVINPAFSRTPLLEKLLKERDIARSFAERRHDAWDESYTLYRNKVFTNRLTQRQAVNIPLMKETIKTLLSKIDDPPIVEWKELGGNQLKELILNEIWNNEFDEQFFEGVDLQDKKTVLLYGRSFKKLNFIKSRVKVTALDIFDIVIDPLVDPLDIETARYLIQQNIFRSLREILADSRYTSEGKEKLKSWAMTPEGMVSSAENRKEWELKMERLKAMGVDSSDFSLFAAGDVIVNLNEHYTKMWNGKDFEKRVIVYADDSVELLDEKLEDLIGVDFWPFVTWGEDIETIDFWSDGPADLVRVPNKLINIWFSQLTENRTLKNFQMHWYDATIQGYSPQTYEPGPGRMLPAPGNPKDVIMPVEVSGLDDTLTSIDFVTKLIERGTSATAIEKGVTERAQITLGEVQTLVGKASERMLSMAKFYKRSWRELAMKWYRIMDANHSKVMTLYKTSSKGKIWPLKVYPVDWKSKEGYKAYVHSSSEQEDEKTRGIQRFMFLLAQFPQNAALRRVAQKRMLDIADLTPDEMREIQEEEKKMQEFMEQQAELQQQLQQQEIPQEQPVMEGEPQAEEPVDLAGTSGIADKVGQLMSLAQEDAQERALAEKAGRNDDELKERLQNLLELSKS